MAVKEGEAEIMKKYLLILLCTTLLTGCVEKQIIDELNIETAQGYDLAENDHLKGTLLYVKYLPDKSFQNQTLTTVAETSRDVLTALERRSSDPLVTGGIQAVLFGEELAKHGFVRLIDSLLRDPNVGSRILLAMVEKDNAQDVLEGNYGFKGNGTYIKNLLTHNMKNRDVPKLNLHLFGNYYASRGRDAFLPILKKINDNTLEIVGIGIFSINKVVYKVSEEKMFYFKLMVDKYSEGSKIVNYGKNEAVIRSIHSKNKIKIIKSPDKLHANIYINVDAVVREYSGKKVSHKVINGLEQAMEKDIKKECLKMLHTFQDRGIDPVGLGEYVKSKTKHYNYDKWWDEDYKKITLNVIPKVTIMESGTVE